MDLGLAGHRAIVTGGSRGIGLAVARGLVAEGAAVAVVARNAENLDAAAAGLRAAAPDATVLAAAADTTDDVSVHAVVDRVVAELGGVQILVNAAARPAGGARIPSLAELTDAAVLDDFDTKVMGYGAGSSLGRMVTAAEVADVVVFLASPRAVAVSGDAVGAGGGNRGVAHY